MKQLLIVSLTILFAHAAFASNMDSDLSSLGTTSQILERARDLSPGNRIEAVERRTVDLHNRLEFDGNYGFVLGGDSYLFTQNFGLGLQYHINPRWSFGGEYNYSMSSLTPQAQSAIDQANQAQANGVNYTRPEIDSPLSSYMALIDFYPVYGKLDWFQEAITQFDLYLTAGYGRMSMVSGASPLYTAGVGAGLWLTQYLAARIESRWESYSDVLTDGPRQLNAFVTTLSVGLLL